MGNQIMKRTMKGQLSELPNAVIALTLIAIIAAVGILVLVNFQNNSNISSCTAGSYLGNGACTGTNTVIPTAAYNSIGQGVTGVTTVTGFLSLIALVIVAAIIIGLVVYAFARGGAGSERF